MSRAPFLLASLAVLVCASGGLRAQEARRALAIEDYYRVLTVTNPQISPDGKSVRFSVTTRVASDNSTKTETFTVPARVTQRRERWSTPTCGRGTSRGIPTASSSRSQPTPISVTS